VRRDEVSGTNETSGHVMASLPSNGDSTSDDIHPICIQPSGCTVTANDIAIGMEDQSPILSTTGTPMGATSGGPICVGTEQTATDICLMEIPSRCSEDRRPSTQLDRDGQPLHLPPMESSINHLGEDTDPETDSNSNNPMVAECNMVPNHQGDGSSTTNPDPSGSSPTSRRKRKRSPQQESTLVIDSMENKRRRKDLDAGLSPSAITLLDSAGANSKTRRQYLPTQEAFAVWAQQEGFDPSTPNAIAVVNYLCHARIIYSWSRNTTLNKKSAILKLYDDTSVITGNIYFQRFMAAMKSTGVFQMEHVSALDISPILSYFRMEDNVDLDMPKLSRKLCWLLGVCAFLRPDDIGCIDVSKSETNEKGLLLTIVFPKERRDGQRIIKSIF
ncbi:hypothetical protein BX616_008074, partial [Lobosporangium transversale]